MPKTPEQRDLPYVEKELEELQMLLACMDITVMQNPTKKQLLSILPKQQIIHLSCHGCSAIDPSQSSLLLQDWKTTPLTVSDLTSLNIDSAEFAFLSACHTSSVRGLNLLDESISLSSAVQLSGYPSVVGTLWQVTDVHSAQVASEVYRWMLGKEGKLDIRRSAEALHWAIHSLRDRTRTSSMFNKKVPNDPLIWASFIHVGN